MKTVKVKFVGFLEGFDFEHNPLFQTINKHYHMELSETPDYIISSVFQEFYEYCKYPQIRIMYSGENYIPDFNLVDYSISPYPISFLDRHLYLPQFINNLHGFSIELMTKSRDYNRTILDNKPFFANFIVSHDSEHNLRGDFFKKLCVYKRVESPGSYLNNIEVVPRINHIDGSKITFQKKSKFTLCFESTAHEGFITEKLTDAFYADTIPIYYGSSTVKDIFNEKAFINVSDYQNFDAVIERIIELDNDDEQYLDMLRQPIFYDKGFICDRVHALDEFVINIFEQPIETAYRRSRVFWPMWHEEYLVRAKDILCKYDNKTLFDFSGRDLLGLLKERLKKRLNK